MDNQDYGLKIEEYLLKKEKTLLEEKDFLKKHAVEINDKIKDFQIEMLKWLGRKIENFLIRKRFLNVKVEYFQGSDHYMIEKYLHYDRINGSILPDDERNAYLWLNIKFNYPHFLSFRPNSIIFERRINETELTFERLKAIFKSLEEDYSSCCEPEKKLKS